MRRRAIILILLLAVLICGLTALAHLRQRNDIQQTDALYITVLRPGEGDAVVLTCGEDTMVLLREGAGDAADLESFLRQRGVDEVDLLAGPGAKTPLALSGRQIRVAKRAPHTELMGTDVVLGSARIHFSPADDLGAVLVTVEHGDNLLTFLTGEVHAEVPVEESDLLLIATDEADSSEVGRIADRASPDYAVLLDRDEAPADDSVELLESRKIAVLQLSESSVRITSDGSSLEMKPEFGIWE